MPPKKKPGSGKKKGKGKGDDPALPASEQEGVDKLIKAGTEIEILQKELDHSNDLTYRLKHKSLSQRQAIDNLSDQLHLKSLDRIDITSDMTRQYKSMQAEMTAKIENLENLVAELKTKLANSQQSSQDAAMEYQRIIKQKDETIDEQKLKMIYMSNEFESMLNETLSKMSRKLEAVSQRWKENDSMHLSENNQRRLADFHLNRLTTRE